MTEQEAIEELKTADRKIASIILYSDEKEWRKEKERESKELQIAIKALEKQIPKKPTYDGDGYAPDGTFVWDEWLCPCCRSRYEIDYDEYDFCPNCGQAIDWSEKIE